MTQIALSHSESLRVAVAGTRIPARARSDVTAVANLLQEAKAVLAEAHGTAQSIREKARAAGYAEGTARAQAMTARHLLEAQRNVQEFVAASQERIVTLALAILVRIAPRLGPSELVPALVLEALNGVTADQSLRIHVHPEAVGATIAALSDWQREHSRIEAPQVIPDATLDAFGCVVESEFGRVEAGLTAQLSTIRDALACVAGGSGA